MSGRRKPADQTASIPFPHEIIVTHKQFVPPEKFGDNATDDNAKLRERIAALETKVKFGIWIFGILLAGLIAIVTFVFSVMWDKLFN